MLDLHHDCALLLPLPLLPPRLPPLLPPPLLLLLLLPPLLLVLLPTPLWRDASSHVCQKPLRGYPPPVPTRRKCSSVLSMSITSMKPAG
jgi:hypothetical protein